jgi:hypothetical protein
MTIEKQILFLVGCDTVLSYTVKMEAARSFETLVATYKTTRRHSPGHVVDYQRFEGMNRLNLKVR